MTTLLLVRHGRSTSNAAGTLAGRTPGIDLDETGRSQAMAVGERLRGVELAAAVRSPIDRCGQTLDLVLQSAALAPESHVDERLSECDYGDWSGRLLSELAEEPLWTSVQQNPSEVAFPAGESMLQMRERMVAAVADWNSRLPAGATWLLVGHGDPIKAVLSDALAQPFDAFQRIMVDPGSISVVHYPEPGKGVPMVAVLNSTSGQVRDLLPSTPQGPGPQLGGGLGTRG